MQDLLQQQQKLKRSKFVNNSIIFVHTYILGPMGVNIAIVFYDVNIIVTILGLSIVVYSLLIGMYVIMPFCLNRQEAINKKLIETDKNIKQVEQIHFSLDLLRDSILFDEDESYWQTIEKLPVLFDESN